MSDEREARIERVEALLQERTQSLNDREAELRRIERDLEEARKTKTPPSIVRERSRLAAHSDTLTQLQKALEAEEELLRLMRYDLRLRESELNSRELAIAHTERALAKRDKRREKAKEKGA